MKYLIVCTALVLSSCVGLQRQQNLKNLETWFNARIGMEAKDEIVKQFGIPTQQMETDNLEIWTYIYMGQAYQTTNGFQGNQNGVVNPGFAMTQVQQSYEKLTCAWDVDGKLSWWKYEQQ